jgi:hypothetical protein
MLQAIKVKGHVGSDGILKLVVPAEYQNQDIEAVLVVQSAALKPTDANGWPIGFFESLDQIEADDVMERPSQGTLETRESIE